MIDPRGNSPTKIIPPAPLPAVSRKRLRKVKDFIPPPCSCRYCNGPVVLIANEDLYGRPYGKWPYMYMCWACNAYVGLHAGTDLPLGTLAKKELRAARSDNKALFFAVIERYGISRDEAYENLATKLRIPRSDCHFGWFDEDMCNRAGEICRAALEVAP